MLRAVVVRREGRHHNRRVAGQRSHLLAVNLIVLKLHHASGVSPVVKIVGRKGFRRSAAAANRVGRSGVVEVKVV